MKLCIVYDGSKLNSGDCSLNDCLQVGPTFVPKLLDILIQFQSHPVGLTANIGKALLMIGISEAYQDTLCFLWVKDPTNCKSKVMHLRFTRLGFELWSSSAVLGAVILHHLESYKDRHPELIKLIERCFHVDDLVTGANNIKHAFDLYKKAKQIMKEAGLNLGKWNPNSQTPILLTVFIPYLKKGNLTQNLQQGHSIP